MPDGERAPAWGLGDAAGATTTNLPGCRRRRGYPVAFSGTPRSDPPGVMHYLLLYDTVPDFLERRAAFRDEHLRLAWAAHERGALELGGALDPADGAVLLFRGDSPDAAEAFAAADPYVRHGLVTRWRVRAWKTVVGAGASTPVRPES
jgi:uncharacterized protein YciI